MALLETRNIGAYLGKQAIDGYIVKLDLESAREPMALLRGVTNNLSQIALRANETRSIYDDVENMREWYAEL